MMFTGTTQQQDTRFSDKEKKLLKQMKFGDCLNKRVDMSKVKLDAIRPWISKKITDILHIEDDVVVNFVYNQLEEEKFPCPKKMQINMTGFLNGRNARQFMGELWSLLLSAQESEIGIPAEFIQQKKEEILKREEEFQARHNVRSRSRTSRSHSRDRDKESDRDRRGNRDRSHEGFTQREREQQLPASTLSAIEHVRAHLSAKSRSESRERGKIGSSTKDTNADGIDSIAASGAEGTKSPSSRTAAAEAAAAKIRNRSPRKRSAEPAPARASSRTRNSPDRHCDLSRDKAKRRSSRSSRRRSPDRNRRRRSRSRSKDRRGRQQTSSRRKSRSDSPAKRRSSPKSKNHRRSVERKYRSKSVDKRKHSPKKEKGIAVSPRRRRSTSRNSNTVAAGVNGHNEVEHTKMKSPLKSSEKRTVTKLTQRKNRSASTQRCTDRSLSPGEKKWELSFKKESPSRTATDNNPKDAVLSPGNSWRSSSSPEGLPQRGRRRSNTSLSHSPDDRKEDFEIRKTKNSVQKTRHYRSNRDTSASSLDRETGKRQPEDRRRAQHARRSSPRPRSPARNERGGRNQRSGSRRRSKSRVRSRSPRNHSRSSLRRSRSPRRFNRRRSPQPQNFRGRGGMNRGRMNNWRRSPSPRGRGRGGGGSNVGGGSRFERGGGRLSPQRRFSRERRMSPIQNQFRKFSPVRRFSPISQYQQRRSRDRRPSSHDRRFSPQHDHRTTPYDCRPSSQHDRRPSPQHDRRPSPHERRPFSPARAESRERGGNFNRWDQGGRIALRQKCTLSSESSSSEDIGNCSEIARKISPIRQASLSRNNGRRHRSSSYSQEQNICDVSPAVGKAYKNRESTGRFSVEYSGPPVKTIDLCKEDKLDTHKSKFEPHAAAPPKKQSSTTTTKREPRRDRYSSSLSRTPSPFLKPHEREKLHKATTAALAAAYKKKLAATAAASKQHNRKDNDSSSSESSDSSDSEDDYDYDEEVEELRKEKKKVFAIKKPESRTQIKRKKSISSESEEESEDEKYHKKANAMSTATKERSRNSAKSTRKDTNAEDNKRCEKLTTEEKEKSTNQTEVREPGETARKSSKSALNVVSVSSVSVAKRVAASTIRAENKKAESIADPQGEDKVTETEFKQAIELKRSLSATGLKKQRHKSSDSDEPSAKKKRKKAKKSSKHHSSESDSSESEEESAAKKKKHKKHKKQSKKSKKHKKHKKKSKKGGSSSSSADEGGGVAIKVLVEKTDKVSKTMLHGVLNEDLEKQLREKALNSMKKME